MPLITLVFTDVVNSTAIKRHPALGRDSRERDQAYLKTIQKPYFSLVRACLRPHDGKEIKTIGDAFFLTFEDPVQAVRCTLEIQKRLTSEPIDTPLGPLRLRIGIHSGFPESFEEDWHGADVDLAARVEGAGAAQQILLSSRTYELVRDMNDVKFHSHGEPSLKGVGRVGIWEVDWDGKGPRPTAIELARQKLMRALGIAALGLIAGSVAFYFLVVRTHPGNPPKAHEPHNQSGRPSVAVLEFKNQGSETDEWLATAICGMLTSELAAGGQLRAISSDDVASVTAGPSLAAMISFSHSLIGKRESDLGADYVVSGSYSASGVPPTRSLHVELRLEDEHNGETVSTASYDGTQSEIFALVQHIGADLRAKLAVPTNPAPQEAPANPEALQLYAEGLKKLHSLDAIGARDDLQEALKLEPDNALVHAALAYAWEILGYDQSAEEEAQKAFETSKSLGDPGSDLVEARYRTIHHEWDRAIEIYRSLWALKLDEPRYLLEVASVEIDADRGQDALTTLGALSKAEKDADKDPRIDYEEALANEKLSNVKAEHSAAEKAAKQASAEGADFLAGEAYWQDCGALLALGDLKAAETACQNAQQKANLAAGRLIQARASTNLGRIMQQQGRLPQALALHENALGIAKDIGSQKDIIGALLNIAGVQSSQGQMTESKRNQDEAIEIANRIGDTQQILIWQTNRGADLYTQGDYAAAKTIYEQELVTARKAGDLRLTSDTMQNLAILLFQLGDLREAQRNMQQALAIAEKAGLQSETASGLSNLGDIQMALGDLPGAQKNYKDALKLSTRINDQANVAGSHLCLAKLAAEQGKIPESETLARQAIAEFQSQNLADNEADAHSTLAGALIDENKLSDAEAEINAATKLAPQDRTIQLSIQITAAKLKAQTGEVQEAKESLAASLVEAKRLRLLALELEIRLADCQIGNSLDSASAREQLRTIETDAHDAGFKLVAKKATSLRGWRQ